MDIFRAEPHTTILFGRGTEEQVGNEVKLSGGSRVLIHYGDRRFVDQSLIDRVRHSFDEAGIDCYEMGGVKKNTRIDVVEEGIKLCRDNQIDFVLSIGSGSVVGSAKAIAVGAVWDGDFRQNLERKREVSGALPVGLIVTVPGNGSELSNGVIVTEDPPEGK
ncbi:MAG: iron-containing alcohol dehydrogenase, partial [Succinatimonas hippei]|nr:iron-containing alcohol dehydrogenase [Succinatimonas hippei]